MSKEPQSYGSEKDWVTGHTGQEVNKQKGDPGEAHWDFYDNRRDSESSGPDQGGRPSEDQMENSIQLDASAADEPEAGTKKVTGTATGAKRDGYFKDRDYKQ